MAAKPLEGPSGQGWVDAELVEIFHRNVPTPILALNVFLASILAYLLHDHVPWQWWGGWVGLITLVAVRNGWRNARYRRARGRADFSTAKWARSFTFGATLNGTVWGIGGALLYTPTAPLDSMFVLLVICGVAAGVTASQSSLPRALFGFLLPAILIPAVRALFFRDSDHLALVILLVTYLGFLSYIARSNHRTLRDSVLLRFSNQNLLEALTERERHFRSLIENALDWVSVVRADGTFLFLSPSVAELLGWQPDELQGRAAREYVHPDDLAQVESEFQRVLADGGISAIEARWRHREGRWVLFQGLVHGLGGDEPRLVMNARDVTERRAIERDLRRAKESAEAASRIKDQFLASISHEIRTPLHAMQGMADLLIESPLTARQRDYVDGFQQAVGHLTRLVNDVLDFSRMNAGGVILTQAPFDLRELIEGVSGLMSAHARTKEIDLRVDLPPDLAPSRLGDVGRLRQVLVNLVGNAVKFTDRGSVRIAVTEEGGELLFRVSDTGRGIPADKHELLFRPFYQVDASSTREFGGAGLGLAISRGLVEAMGGTIGVESRPGEGSTFWFRVCLPPSPTAPAEPAVAASNLPAAKLLVVDDAELNLMVIREFFRDTPCRVEFARNGREAVAAWESGDFALILMDIQMPEMDGWQATRAIRKLEQQTGRRPVIIVALTAGALDEDRSKALAVGCSDFLSKPVAKDRLLSLVASLLRGESPVREKGPALVQNR